MYTYVNNDMVQQESMKASILAALALVLEDIRQMVVHVAVNIDFTSLHFRRGTIARKTPPFAF